MARHEAQGSGKKRKRAKEEDGGATAEPVDALKNPPPCSVWKNLDLILSLQDKAITNSRKIELAFDLVGSDCGAGNRGRAPVQFFRVVSFLGDWVQPLLISSEHGNRKSSDSADACLDYRLWVVLKFCLENSTISISQSLLRPVTRVLVHVVSALDREEDSTADSTSFYRAFSECLSLVFSCYGRTLNVAGVDLWISCAVAAVGLILKILSSGRCAICNQEVLLCLSLLLLEQFASFLRFHPTPKNIFRSFVDRVLETLLEVLVLLQLRAGDGKCKFAGKLLTAVEDVLSHGLFHPAHMTGFLSARSSSTKTDAPESKSYNESYHRHFFTNFRKIVTEKKVVVMGGFGSLFCLFVTIARKKRGGGLFALSKASNKLEKDQMDVEKENETNKPLFEVFIQFVEPLVLECRRFTKMDFSGGGESWETKLLEIQCTLKTLNDILRSLMLEKVYERIQDSPEGTHFCFLKKMYDTIIDTARKMYLLWSSVPNVHEEGSPEMLPLIAKELIVSVRCFLEIEYKVVGDDLVGIWFMMLSYLSIHLSTVGTTKASFLINDILRAGCLMISMYSELRQAGRPIFALCEAVRFFRFSDIGGDNGCSTIFPFRYLSSDACTKAVMTLLCSQDLRSAVSNAIKSIPEGQASGCVQQVKSDFTESLEWIRVSFMKIDGVYNPSLLHEYELFGGLSEVYSTVLESLTVTMSNSISIGNSINDLMTALRLIFSSFVQNQSNNLDDFYISFTGRKLNDHFLPYSRGLLDTFWIFVVFFRLYVSCRSLYLQAIGVMPPDSSKKAASEVGNLLNISSGLDWEGVADWTDGGYFSWIVKPSISLLVLIQSVSKTFLMDNVTFCAPLVFVLHVMALQRLTDLNRQVRSLEYLLQRDLRLAEVQVLNGIEHLPYKQHKKWKRLLKVTMQEAADLTNFMTENISLLTPGGQLEAFQVEKAGEDGETLSTTEDAWDMCVCSLNERSLPVAIWLLFCQNIDLWCTHASKRSLKGFSTHLVHHALSCFRNCSGDNIVQMRLEPLFQRRVMAHQVSINLLKNIAFYEQPVLLGHLTSRLSHLLKKSISRALGTNMDLSSLPDWPEILSSLDKMPFPHASVGCPSNNNSAVRLLHSVSSDPMHPEDCIGSKFPPMKLEVGICQRLLILLCKLPKVLANLRSLSAIVPYVLNLEWFVASILLSCHDKFSYPLHDVLSLFLSCRRTLRYLFEASIEDNTETKRSSGLDILSGSPCYTQWLLKSTSKVVRLSHAHFGDEHANEVIKMFSMLMDHTSYLFLALSKVQMNKVIHFVLSGREIHLKHAMHDVPKENDTVSDAELFSNSSGDIDGWKSLKVVASVLKKEAETFLLTFGSMHNEGQEAGLLDVNWNNLSNTLSCFQGFLWGLISALDNVDKKHFNRKALNLIVTCSSELFSCITVFDEFIDCCLKLSPMKGENPEAGFTIRQLFMSAAAILKLRHTLSFLKAKKIENDCDYMLSSSTQILVATCDSMLSEMADSVRIPQHSDLFWIDGVLKYLEVLGSCFSVTNSVVSENMYSQMINVHLRAMGKCICLQGKAATLASHETGSYTKMLQSELGKDDSNTHSLDECENKFNGFKARLRMSFKELIRRQLQSDLVLVVQALERMLVGVQQGCNMVYEIKAGDKDGGKVSAVIVAAIDCFDLVFDSFSGRNLLGIIRSCTQNFVGSLFNIILHLQTPVIFYRKQLSSDTNKRDPDPGSTILMCIEMLTKIVRKHSQLKMDPCNVGHSLHVPASLFKHFNQLKTSQALSDDLSFLDNTTGTSMESVHHFIVDHQFSVDLYAACCGLLCSILRHQTSEAAHCISLLEDSVKVLLTCLELRDADQVNQKIYFVLTTHEAVKCASFLRRVYEEVRQQKDIIGTYSSHLLCDYICVHSGYGLLGTGIKREVDKALRQGVYALIDMCSPEDFQSLHTVLGEGPCRGTLASLRQDYQLHFQYQGKI